MIKTTVAIAFTDRSPAAQKSIDCFLLNIRDYLPEQRIFIRSVNSVDLENYPEATDVLYYEGEFNAETHNCIRTAFHFWKLGVANEYARQLVG